tara:strand:+ start:67 stop:243 length:177 start_codon:yes stop_codon:yes gene_type:complete
VEVEVTVEVLRLELVAQAVVVLVELPPTELRVLQTLEEAVAQGLQPGLATLVVLAVQA